MDTHRIDLHQLECLQVLVAERHVTRAAERLGLTQAKLSSILARIRTLTGDPLLVRTAQGMEPTSTAIELAEHARELLARIHGTVNRRNAFDPTKAELTFTIHAVDLITATILTNLMAHLRRTAPGIKLMIGPLRLELVREALERGEADLVVGLVADAPGTLHISRLLEMAPVCIAATDHPQIQGVLTLEQYAAAAHAAMSFGRADLPYISERALDDRLADLGVTRNKMLETYSVLAVAAMVARTDLIATVPRELALRAAQSQPLQVLPLPFEHRPTQLSMLWHSRSQGDVAHEWMRAALRKICKAEREGGPVD